MACSCRSLHVNRATGGPPVIDQSARRWLIRRVYNVIVAFDSSAWETGGMMTIDAPDRFNTYSDWSEADGIAADNAPSLQRLEGSPALLFYEDGAEGPTAANVRYGRVSHVSHRGGRMRFQFTEEGTFTRAVLEEFQTRLRIQDWERTRTHWAMKHGDLPPEMMARMVRTYDVVFSFAGEDRAYVEAVAQFVRARGVRVFYDFFEQVELWGAELPERFDQIYGNSSRHCVLFISAAYRDNVWTRLERRTALNRAMRDNTDYLLPARFDDTDIPGIRSSVGFIDLRRINAEDFGRLILRKLGQLDR